MPVSIYVAVGSLEEEGENKPFKMISNVLRMGHLLEQTITDNLELKVEVLQEHTHATTPERIWEIGLPALYKVQNNP